MNTGPTTSGGERAEPVPQAKTPRVRIQDVAALSGLSICTVSRALRQLPNVSAQAKARVGDAAAQLGYKASSAASRLAGGNTGSVAIIAPTATAWFFARAVEAAEEVFADSGYDTVLISLRNRPSVQQKLFGEVKRGIGVAELEIARESLGLAIEGVEASGTDRNRRAHTPEVGVDIATRRLEVLPLVHAGQTQAPRPSGDE